MKWFNVRHAKKIGPVRAQSPGDAARNLGKALKLKDGTKVEVYREQHNVWYAYRIDDGKAYPLGRV